MTGYHRSGHYRTSPQGTVHWVNGHTVHRDDWSHLGGGYSGWDPRSTWGGGSGLDSPNAICPECGAAVYFLRPANGGAVWFDELGPPWPKHPCMDTASARTRHPEPREVPATRLGATVPAGWIRHGAGITTFLAGDRVWSFSIGARRFVVPREPPRASSPLYFQWVDEARGVAELQYLTHLDDEVATITTRVYAHDRVDRGWPPRAPDDSDWDVLACWIGDVSGLPPARVAKLVSELRNKVDWLLDPGWSNTISDPRLVLTRVEQVFAGVPGLEADDVVAWMAYVLD